MCRILLPRFCAGFANFNRVTACHEISPWHQKCFASFRDEAVTSCRTSPANFSGGPLVRRQDLLKPDVMSEVIVVAMGAVLFAILILFLITVLTRTVAPL